MVDTYSTLRSWKIVHAAYSHAWRPTFLFGCTPARPNKVPNLNLRWTSPLWARASLCSVICLGSPSPWCPWSPWCHPLRDTFDFCLIRALILLAIILGWPPLHHHSVRLADFFAHLLHILSKVIHPLLQTNVVMLCIPLEMNQVKTFSTTLESLHAIIKFFESDLAITIIEQCKEFTDFKGFDLQDIQPLSSMWVVKEVTQLRERDRLASICIDFFGRVG